MESPAGLRYRIKRAEERNREKRKGRERGREEERGSVASAPPWSRKDMCRKGHQEVTQPNADFSIDRGHCLSSCMKISSHHMTMI